MQVTVIVTIKPGVIEPQGQVVIRVLPSIDLVAITDVRQGKIFHIQIDDELLPKERRKKIHRLAKEVLTNPVYEEYKIIWR